MYDDNYKDQLLRYFNLHKLGHPTYREISVEESTNMKIFTVGIVDPSFKDQHLPAHDEKQYIASAVGSTKKRAEQLAAKETLRYFGVLHEAMNF
jgi:dsRNA-specific ribonuclease